MKRISESGHQAVPGQWAIDLIRLGFASPNRLPAGQITDLVRLLTIADIFAALIEARPYWPPMSRKDAYKILCDMEGKLEVPLVKAFRPVALVA